MSSQPTIHTDIRSPFAVVTLNRPAARNALNAHMVDELIAAFESLGARADLRGIVLRGADGHFCAGGDLDELQGGGSPFARLDDLLRLISRTPKVVVAQVEGAALGGGFGLVCASDIAIASTTASLGMPEARLGLAPAIIAPYVVQRIGVTRARLLMLTGARFDGVSAHEYGVVQEVCPPEILDECTNAILDEIRQCSPAALAACKALIFDAIDHPASATAASRAALLDQLRAGDDAQEGLRALRENRPPRWAT